MDKYVSKTILSYNNCADMYNSFQTPIKPVKKLLDKFRNLIIGKRILDAGCGHGRESKYLLEKNLEVTGIDLSDKLLKIAVSKAPGCKFIKMDIRRLQFPDNFFDGLWASTSFLHIPKKDSIKTLEEFHRVLKPTGVMYLGIQGHPNEKSVVTEDIARDEKMVATKEFGEQNPRLFVYYSVDEIKKLLRDIGFKMIEISTKKEEDTKILWINLFVVK
ncbi:MAG: class I SAM-dependent methyltransferase [Candidatus Dojkabacteria bacterium]|jgi:ubiquinone/menaquinone biosynthesis C-methylase UbiE|nr:class I SAM-dependent methyltransferase [Candidatus Dojkabacteria bacterium]